MEVAGVIFICGRTKETGMTAWKCGDWVESLGCGVDLLELLPHWRNTSFVIRINQVASLDWESSYRSFYTQFVS